MLLNQVFKIYIYISFTLKAIELLSLMLEKNPD